MSSGSRRSRNDPPPKEETWWEVVEILAEEGKRYQVRWAGNNPKTGKPWPLSWVPNTHCSSELIKGWEKEKAKKEPPLESPQVTAGHNRPADRVGQSNLTKSSEPHVPIRKRKHPFPSNTDDDPKSSRKRRAVAIIASQPGGDLGSGSANFHHILNRADSPGDAPPHPPFEEIEMWVPTPTAKFGPPKRKHATTKPTGPTKERRTDSIVSTGAPVRTQAALAMSRQPIGLSESQIIDLREEEEESQSQLHGSVARRSPKLGSPSHDSTPNDPLQTFTGDTMGEAGEKSQEVRDNHPTDQLSTDSQPIDRHAITSHTTNSPIEGGSDILPTPTLPGPTRKSWINSEVPTVIASSAKSLLTEKHDRRANANSNPSPASRFSFLDRLRRGSGTLAERRAFEARARLDLVRRAAAHTTGNFVEGCSSTSIAPQTTTPPPPHVVLQQVLNRLESPSQSQAAMENVNMRAAPSEPREAGPSVESKEDMVTQDKSDHDVNLGTANLSSQENEQSPPDEVPPTTQSSTRTQSPHASSQASLSSQLAVALKLLHKKSEEISGLQAQVDALRVQPTDVKVNLGAERAPFSVEGADHVAAGVQTDQIMEAQVAFDLERSRWAEEKSALQSESDALRADKAQALIDVEFFRAQYQRASDFTSTTRSENEELLARATLAESQAVNGIAMIRATFEARVGKLESEAGKYRALSEMLTDRARRTDDALRYRAAIAPELEREYHRLQGQLDEREGELDEIKDELRAEKKVNSKLRRLVARLEAEGLADGRKSHDGEPSPRSSDDEDYVPGTSRSPNENSPSSPPRSQQAHDSNNAEDVTMAIDQDAERLAGDDSANRTDDDMVYLCWWKSGEGSCDAVVASISELHEHVLSRHLSCH